MKIVYYHKHVYDREVPAERGQGHRLVFDLFGNEFMQKCGSSNDIEGVNTSTIKTTMPVWCSFLFLVHNRSLVCIADRVCELGPAFFVEIGEKILQTIFLVAV